MKLAKFAMMLALGSMVAPVFAESSATAQAPVETYNYAMKLDIAKVIAVTDISDRCGPAPVQMTYQDSKGQQHVVEYQAMGTDCTNG
ncbi:DUF2790 domain-containing protein [Pseudomonas sp. NPDC090202]|uniref:DUF2790 domain-containing protein n=1 Tax=unclassified Pseudomonas TaxID=196821 RepID=UPI00380A7125